MEMEKRKAASISTPRLEMASAMAIPSTATNAVSVDCQKDVRCWRSMRSVMEFLIPCCACHSITSTNDHSSDDVSSVISTTTATSSSSSSASASSSTRVTGTIFGERRGRVRLCIQEDPSRPPLLLIDLGIPTLLLAREMQHGLLRIALECQRQQQHEEALLDVPLWTMYCNGRKVGYARRRIPSEKDWSVLKTIKCVFVGAGLLTRKKSNENSSEELLYMRGSYKRVCGSSDCESFHLINPDGSGATRQELSIFFLRS